MNRQRLILFISVIVLIAAVIWSFSAAPRQKTVSKLKYAPGQKAASAVQPSRSSARQPAGSSHALKIALLDQDQGGFKGYRRNIFKPVFVDEFKLLKQKAAAFKVPAKLPPPVRFVPPTLPPVQQQPVAVQPEAAQLARFTFLGFMKKDAVKTIFLSKDKEILLVKIGDTIAGRYQAKAITEKALTLVVTETGDEIVIPLIENRSLAKAGR
ncbi:MAG TPA: hypothetical protein HPP94_14085 [Desulfuromonadales bacterium]|nr:hypothetical protein [Desulfuromonadales bacterium]